MVCRMLEGILTDVAFVMRDKTLSSARRKERVDAKVAHYFRVRELLLWTDDYEQDMDDKITSYEGTKLSARSTC